MKDIKVDTEKEKKAELQQKLVVYQLMQKHLEELREQALMLERKFVELETAKQTLSDLEKTKKGNELFFPLGAGIYAKANVHDNKDLMMDLGAGIVARKSPASAKKILEEREKEIEDSGKGLQDEMTTTAAKLNEIANELQKMAGQ